MSRFWLGPALVDLSRSEVRHGESVDHLTGREAALLAWLFERPGVDVSRRDLLQRVFGYKAGVESRAVDFTVHRLRRKIEADPARPVHLVASPGHGYRLDGVRVDTASVGSAAAALTAAPGLVGRSAESAALRAWLSGPAAPLFLVGPGGVGKTALARALLEDAPNAVFVDLSLSEASALDLPAAVQSAANGPFGDRPLLIDNAEHVQDLVLAWLSGPGARRRVLVTSRIAPTGLPTLGVSPLGTEDGLALLHRLAPTVDPAAGRALVAALEGLPLAIEIATTRLGTIAADTLARRLAAGDLRLLGRGAGRQGSLDAVLAWSWVLLPPDAQALVRAAAVFAAPFDFEAIEAVSGLDCVVVAEALDEVERHHWLVRVSQHRYRLAPPLRAWLGEPDPAAVARHLTWCCAGGAPLADQLRAFDRARDPESRLVLARALPADAFAPDESMPARAERLRGVLEWFPEDAHLHWALGMAYALSGLRGPARASLERAAALVEDGHDEELRGKIEGQLGNVAAYGGESDRAIQLFHAAVDRLVGMGARCQAATFRANLGSARLARGELEAAETELLQALADMDTRARAANRGRVHANLASLYVRRGQDALAEHHEALAEQIFREADDRMCLGQLLGNRAVRRLDMGLLEEARRLAEGALVLHRDLGNTRSEAMTLMTLGDIGAEERDPSALVHLAGAASRLAAAGDRRFEGWARWRWGRAVSLAGGDGATLVRVGIDLLRTTGDRRGAGIGQWVLAALDPAERLRAEADDPLTRSLAAVLDGRPPELREHEVRMQERLVGR